MSYRLVHVAPPLPLVEVTALSSRDTRAAAEVIHRVTMRYKLLPKLFFLTSAYYTRLLTRLSQLTHRFSEFSWFDGCKVLVFLHAHPEKGL